MMGLSSGLDTDSIIQQTLRVHQMRIDSQMRKRTILHWKQETYNSVKDQITGFRNTFLSSLGSTTMMQRSVYNSTIASLNKTTNAISISGTINSSVGTMRIGAIESLAKGASIFSAKGVSSDKNGFSSSQRLDSFQFADGAKINFSNYQTTVSSGGNNLTISQEDAEKALNGAAWTSKITASDGTEITLTRTGSGDDTEYTYSINGGPSKEVEFEDGAFSVKIGENDDGEPVNIELTQMDGGRVGYEGNALAFTKEANVKAVAEDGTESMVKIAQSEDGQIWHNGRAIEFAGSAKVKINGTEIELKSNMTLNQMLSTVNNTKGIGATMSYDRLTDSFKLESKTIGSLTLDVSDLEEGNALKLFGLDGIGEGSKFTEGSSAVVYINGEKVERDTNTFEYRGVKITLHEEKTGSTDLISAPDDDIIVTLKRDATDAVNRIKGFIEAYNSIIKRIEGLVSERKTSA